MSDIDIGGAYAYSMLSVPLTRDSRYHSQAQKVTRISTWASLGSERTQQLLGRMTARKQKPMRTSASMSQPCKLTERLLTGGCWRLQRFPGGLPLATRNDSMRGSSAGSHVWRRAFT